MRVEEPGLLRERIHCEAAIGDLGVRRYSSVGPKAWRLMLRYLAFTGQCHFVVRLRHPIPKESADRLATKWRYLSPVAISQGWLRYLFGYLMLPCPQISYMFLEDQTDCSHSTHIIPSHKHTVHLAIYTHQLFASSYSL